MGARAFGVAATLVALMACSGAADDPLLDFDSGGGDDGGFDFDAEGTDGGNCTGSCSAPDGFAIVHLAQGQCPSGWVSADAVTSPTAGDGACACGCNVTQAPSCDMGDVTRAYDDTTTPSCGTGATSFTSNQGGCTAFGGLYLNHAHYAADGPAATGGACSYEAHVDQAKVSGSAVHICSAPASCPALACDGSMCVAQDGDVACPAGYPTKTLVGTGVTATCDGCGAACAVDATCAGKISFFTDTACTTGEVDFVDDGSCVANPAGSIGPYYSYSTVGQVTNAGCAGTPPAATATAALVGAKTVCCH